MLPIEILNVYITTKEDYTTVQPLKFNPAVIYFFTTDVYLNEKILKGNNIEIKPSLFLNRVIFENAKKYYKRTIMGLLPQINLSRISMYLERRFLKKTPKSRLVVGNIL